MPQFSQPIDEIIINSAINNYEQTKWICSTSNHSLTINTSVLLCSNTFSYLSSLVHTFSRKERAVSFLITWRFNDLPDSLFVHCSSKNDDLGKHILKSQEDYCFHFCYVPFITLFHCHVQWGKKTRSFDAYNGKWVFHSPCGSDECEWVAKIDGIYLSEIKKYDWQ